MAKRKDFERRRRKGLPLKNQFYSPKYAANIHIQFLLSFQILLDISRLIATFFL